MENITTLSSLISLTAGKHVYIQTHNFPDPDAIASAYALYSLFSACSIRATICYGGKIDRLSTSRMVELWNIPLVEVSNIKEFNKDSILLYIDTQRANQNTDRIAGFQLACIDHHETYLNHSSIYAYCDIRSNVGACSSIIAEYYFENNITINQDIATALLYGIKVDTNNLSRGVSDLDLDMFYLLYKRANLDQIMSLTSNTLQHTDLEAFAHAINTIVCYDFISFANIGEDCPEALIATISDFMLELDGTLFSVVYSIKKDGIKLSVRNSDKHIDAGKATNIALERIGSGGGHQSMAGGFVPFTSNITKENASSLIDQIQNNFMRELLF